MTLPTSCPKPIKAAPRPRKAIPRSTKPIARKAKPKTRNAKRAAKNRLRAHGTPQFDAWIKSQHCVVCGYTPCDPAHTLSGGGSRKGDAESIIPICRLHHAEQHQFGKHTFAARHALDIPALRDETQRAWLASSEYAAWQRKQQGAT